jgi:hypothetical protein
MACPSSELPGLLKPDSFRFIHIDGSHLYEAVRDDALLAKDLLAPGGIVAFDDYSNADFIGVAAAAWEAVLKTEMIPLCVTDAKLYAGWSGVKPLSEETARTWIEALPGGTVEVLTVLGHPVLRIRRKRGFVRRASEYAGLPRLSARWRLNAAKAIGT